ncbi:MAG: hypothetical protein JWP27_2264 [Flaviaesturariibacter sp.]|nr:hypothetical protein [Flaviaesturariibacter sp.]
MKKFYLSLLFLTLLLAFRPSAQAQLKGFSIGPYVEAALPVGDFGDFYKSGIGGGLGVDIKLPLTSLGVTASAGYMHFSPKNDITGNFNAIPIRAGLKYRLSLLYIKLEAGAASITDNGGTAFIVSPGLGIRVLGLDVQAKYENWSKDKANSGFAGLKVGYNF